MKSAARPPEFAPPPGEGPLTPDAHITAAQLLQRGAEHHRAGRLDQARRDYELALAASQEALRLDPGHPGGHFNRARALKALGRRDEAVEAAARALATEPGLRQACALLVELVAEQVREAEPPPPEPPPSRAGGRGDKVSVVICSVDENKFARVAADYARRLQGREHEIIGIHDARSLCEGYTRGLRRSDGELVVFSHDDVEVLSPDFADRLTARLEQYDVIGVAGTDLLAGESWGAAGWPHLFGLVPHASPGSATYTVCVYGLGEPPAGNIQALDGLFLAARREVAEAVGFDAETFDGFHLYDLDFTFRAHLAGYRLGVCQDLVIAHHSGGNYDQVWRGYAQRFLDKHRGRLSQARGAALGWPVASFEGKAQALAFCRRMAALLPALKAGVRPETPPAPSALPPPPPPLSFYMPVRPTAKADLLRRAADLHQRDRLEDAEELYQRVLAAEPGNADALNLLGLLRYQQRRLPEAAELTTRAVDRKPRVGEFHGNLGMVLRAMGQTEQAIARYHAGLRLDPGHAGILYNLGNALQDSGRPDQAVAWYQRATQASPGFVEAHYNLGNALRSLGRLGEAIQSYQRALEIDPAHAGAHNNLGNVHLDRADFSSAMASYRRVLEISPATGPRARPVDHAGAHSNIVNGLNYDPDIDQERLFGEHLAWDRRHGRPLAALARAHANPPDPARRLRIGYVSGDLCRHTVSYYFLPVLQAHDRRGHEIFCYSAREVEDDMTRRLKALGPRWREVAGLGDRELAELVRADGIDILVDLSGHTAFNRLPAFARRPAPVQVSWLGYFNTTGLAAMDYILMDRHAAPEGQERWFTEEVLRLPHGRFCYAPPDYAPEVAPAPCLASSGATFASFNNLTKISGRVAETWAEILKRTPGARLVLKWKTLSEAQERERIWALFAPHGLERGRVEFRGASPHREMLEQYAEVDIALDPFPFSGGVTSCEALWMGVPVVTWPGARPVSRQTLGFVREIGHPELAAASREEYVRLAVELAGDRQRLARLRAGLRPAMTASPLCDGPGFTAALERVFRELWRRWCAGRGDGRGGGRGEG